MISHLAEMSMDNKFCLYCNVYYNNTVDHCINTCTYLGLERARLWSDIQNISIQAYMFLCTIDKSRVTDFLLGMEMQSLLEYWVIKMSSLSYAALSIFTKCCVSINI